MNVGVLLWVLIGFPFPFSTSGSTLSEQPPADLFPKVRKIIETRCLSCHNNTLKISGLSLESAEGLHQGGSHGPVIVSRNLQQSRLYLRVARLEKPYMPMEGDPLTEGEVALIKSWIEQGAIWPETATPLPPVASSQAGPAGSTESASPRQLSANEVFFLEKVFPILSTRCLDCHNDERKYSGLSLESYLGFQNGGWHGPVVVPGRPDESRLYRRIARIEKTYMPLNSGGGPGDPLPEEEVASVRQWIAQGAHWPKETKAEEAERARIARLEEIRRSEERPIKPEEREWWSFRKPVRPAVPQVKAPARVKNPIDAFIQAALEKKDLQPAPTASKETLIRRVYFDLIGLPPKPEEVESFVKDSSPDAYERLINRLLDSERYGERWGRHWLDVVRYADSDGYEYDRIRPNSWRYRDYVIRAFNQDKPYNRFILEQLAGDELPDRDYDSFIALGFCRNGPFIGDMVLMQNEMTRQDELDDMVTATAATFLGLTVGCARCHNHKYDPIGQKDYYRLVAVFSPSVRSEIPLAPAPVVQRHEHQVRDLDRQIDNLQQEILAIEKPTRQRLLEDKYKELPEPLQLALRTEPSQRTEAQKRQADQVLLSTSVTETALLAALNKEELKKIEGLKAKIDELEKAKPPALPAAMAITDPSPVPPKSYFLHRGSTLSKGSEMQPGALEVLSTSGHEMISPQPLSGRQTTLRRLALARWLASEENPLTARVMVNRLWQYHFGKGLVGTLNDFGRMGEAPTHPELLDWLATELIRQGWSIKALQRLILTSSTYQQSSTSINPENQDKDPENRLLWKMRLRRLEGEMIRDAVLFVSGSLNLKVGGPGIFPEVDSGRIESSPKEAAQLLYQRWPVTRDGPEVWRRSVYVTQKRTIPAPILDLFDPPDNISSCPKRSNTTVAPQALQLLNNKFVVGQSMIFAEHVRNEAGKDPRSQIERAFWLAFSRPPDSKEMQVTLDFLTRQQDYHGRHNEQLLELGIDPAEILSPAAAALVDLCHSLFNANEFVYVN